jgi:hypothetical protein
MVMRNAVLIAVGALLLTASSALAQYVPRNFDKGPVILVQEWELKPGKLNAFMQDYATNQTKSLEIGKKQGAILSYGAALPIARRTNDANVYTTITFKDLTAYDRSYARADQAAVEVYGSVEKAAEAAAKRGEYATLINSRLLQGLVVK